MRKEVLCSVFRRKGRNGEHTRVFDGLEPSQKAALLGQAALNASELPVIGSIESGEMWLIVTTANR